MRDGGGGLKPGPCPLCQRDVSCGIAVTISSNGHIGRDVRVRVITQQIKVIYGVVEQGLRLAADEQLRQRTWLSRDLGEGLLLVVEVQVDITAEPDNFAGLVTALLSQ